MYYAKSHNCFSSYMICDVFLIGPVPGVMQLQQTPFSLKTSTFLLHNDAENT